MDRRSSVINNSTAKQAFAFSKDSRFKQPRSSSNCFGYDISGQFGRKHDNGKGHAFTSSQDRFGYEHVRFKKISGTIDGPGKYTHKGDAFAQTNKYSFGLGRSQMKKLYIDQIIKKCKTENQPGPGHYEQRGTVSAANSTKYSMRIRPPDYSDKKAKVLPGPGQYGNSPLTGVAPINSKMASTYQFGFPRDQRFRNCGSQSPPPGNYDPKHSLSQNFNSIYRNTA